ncbi:hypothetical protein Tsubulata_009275 [Turnera subulata]|uniref:CCHC-type domain-containing protein n=1 Tax=Turnera subulata TaxID=218843 RepID=A0A9Q0FEV3_9ROSI|nr:hypothetical protein Tsubulata_009275 [Turnera subulata]
MCDFTGRVPLRICVGCGVCLFWAFSGIFSRVTSLGVGMEASRGKDVGAQEQRRRQNGQGVQVEEENDELFSKRDRQAIMEMVVLKAISGDEVLTQVPLNEAPIWVQILDIPLNQRSVNNVRGIANRAGKFIRLDEKGAIGWGKFVRARIMPNVEKPLRKSLLIKKESGKEIAVSFRYEGIPNFCYICGKLGHVLKDCDDRSEESDEEERHNYGEWLRASPRKPYSVRLEASYEAKMPEEGGGSLVIPMGIVGASMEETGKESGRDQLSLQLDKFLTLGSGGASGHCSSAGSRCMLDFGEDIITHQAPSSGRDGDVDGAGGEIKPPPSFPMFSLGSGLGLADHGEVRPAKADGSRGRQSRKQGPKHGTDTVKFLELKERTKSRKLIQDSSDGNGGGQRDVPLQSNASGHEDLGEESIRGK